MDLADLAEVGLANTFAAVLASCVEVAFDVLLWESVLPAKDFVVELDLLSFRIAEAFFAIVEPVFPERMEHLLDYSNARNRWVAHLTPELSRAAKRLRLE